MRDIIIKPRYESEKLLIYRSVYIRGELSENEKRYYWNLEKGYEGELMLDDWVRTLSNDFLVLNDLTFDFRSSEFQIDTLLIAQKRIYILDSKNNEGDYYYNADRFYKKGGSEGQDPLSQLRRCELLFRRMLQHLGFEHTIESYLIFVNPEFYLYQAPLDAPIIFPTQLKRFFNKLDTMPSKLNKNHYKLADKLMEICLEKSSNEKIPKYHYDKLKKGFMCSSCHSLYVVCDGNWVTCQLCGFKERLRAAVLRNVKEYRLLFPDRKITTNGIYEWCQSVESKKAICNILSKNFKRQGHGKYTYYI